MVRPMLVDSNVLLDIATNDPTWFEWSSQAMRSAASEAPLVINPLVYAEVCAAYERIEDVDVLLPTTLLRRDPLPYAAGFLAAKAFVKYRRRGGARSAPLPDFYIGAHAAVAGYSILTRDAARYRTYFPTVRVIAPC